MRGPYGFEISEGCQTCKLCRDGFFCNLPPKTREDLDAIKTNSALPAGAILFMEKQAPRGVFMICEGEVKLSISSAEGKTLIIKIAKSGELLGLMASLSNKPYEVTAETLHPCQISFVRRDDFLRFVNKHPEVSQSVVTQLMASYNGACEQLRTVGLSLSVPAKLARLLLEWSAGATDGKAGTRTQMPLTHEEIAECIGSSRETVTRTLSDFRHRNLVTIKGSSLMIPNRAALEGFASA
jgi:CRP/FNR family transcriptional regulator, cyclic AMP receptor protein